jgi:hypothetical protein
MVNIINKLKQIWFLVVFTINSNVSGTKKKAKEKYMGNEATKIKSANTTHLCSQGIAYYLNTCKIYCWNPLRCVPLRYALQKRKIIRRVD